MSERRTEEKILWISTKLIQHSRFANRMQFNASTKAFLDLRASMAARGGNDVAICVRPLPGSEKFEVVYGHRRLAAAAMLGLPVRAVVRDMDDKALVRAMHAENNCREKLCPYEEGIFYKQIKEAEGCSDEAISKEFGKSGSMVSKLLVLADLPIEVVEAFPSPKDLKVEYGPWLRCAWLADPEDVRRKAVEIRQCKGELTGRQVLRLLAPRATKEIDLPIRFSGTEVARMKMSPKKPSVVRVPSDLPFDLELNEAVLGPLLRLGQLRQDGKSRSQEASDVVRQAVEALCQVMDEVPPVWSRSTIDLRDDAGWSHHGDNVAAGDGESESHDSSGSSTRLYAIRSRWEAVETARRAIALDAPEQVDEEAFGNWIYMTRPVISAAELANLTATYLQQRIEFAQSAVEENHQQEPPPGLLDESLATEEQDERAQVIDYMPAATSVYDVVLAESMTPHGEEVVEAALRVIDLNGPTSLSVASVEVEAQLRNFLLRVGRLLASLGIPADLAGPLAETLQESMRRTLSAAELDQSKNVIRLTGHLIRTTLTLGA